MTVANQLQFATGAWQIATGAGRPFYSMGDLILAVRRARKDGGHRESAGATKAAGQWKAEVTGCFHPDLCRNFWATRKHDPQTVARSRAEIPICPKTQQQSGWQMVEGKIEGAGVWGDQGGVGMPVGNFRLACVVNVSRLAVDGCRHNILRTYARPIHVRQPCEAEQHQTHQNSPLSCQVRTEMHT